MDAFEPHDHFYLLRWARDLRHRFPFVDPSSVSHPYALFYYIWKLSYIFGTEYADVSVCFEELVQRPRQQLARLMETLAVRDYEMARLEACIVPQKTGKWREYAEGDWFRRHESNCETVLREFFIAGTETSRLKPATTIPPVGAGFSRL